MSHINESAGAHGPGFHLHEGLRSANHSKHPSKTSNPTGLSAQSHGQASAQPNARTSNVAQFGQGGSGAVGAQGAFKAMPKGKAQGAKESTNPATGPKNVSTSGKAGQVQFPRQRKA
jgi:hypothetical protein